MSLDELRELGRKTIESEQPTGTPIPLEQANVVFRQMFEYPVADFEAEVGFYSEVFGFSALALTTDYALFTYANGAFCLSFRKAQVSHLEGLKLLFMTTDLDGADAHLAATGLVEDRVIRKGSEVQEVIHFSTPAGLAIEIWEDPTED